MSSDWKEYQISALCDLIVDCVNKTAPVVEYETPFKMIRTPNIRNGIVDTSTCRFVEKEVFEKWTRRASVNVGDVLLTREAPMGEIGMVKTNENLFLGQRVMQYRANPKVLNSSFLLYSFLSPFMQSQIFSHEGSGSVVSHIRVPDCLKFRIKIPPLSIQHQIAKILGDLDDKIALNTQINQTLEAMAQALFKSWFVNFDPVKAKMEARASGGNDGAVRRAAMAVISGKSTEQLALFEQKNPEAFATLAETADLFPEAMVESELGAIPEGWEVIRLDSIVSKISKGTTPRKEDLSKASDNCNTPFLKVKDIADSGEIDRMNLELIPLSVSNGVLKRSVLEQNDILVSIAGTIGRVAIVEDDLQGANCNQAVAFVRLKESNKYLEYCRQVLRSSAVQNAILSKVVQGVQANFSLSGLSELKIIKPITSILEAFNLFAVNAFRKQRLLSHENRQLAAIRDTLLPKLLSGEIDLSSVAPELQETTK